MPVSPKERARRLAARGRRPSRTPANGNQQQQPKKPRVVAPGLKFRDIFWNFERIIQLLIMSGVYGGFVWGTCYAGAMMLNSGLVQASVNVVSKVAMGYAQMILPATMLPYAGIIALGVPLAIIGYHFITAAMTGTLFGNNDKSAAVQLTGMIAPFASLLLGPFFGMSMEAAFVMTGVLSGVTTLAMSEFPQEVMQFGGRIITKINGTPDQPAPDADQQQRPAPNQNPAPARNTRSQARQNPAQQPPATPARNSRGRARQNPAPETPAQTRQTRRHGGGTLNQFGRARQEAQPARTRAADAADARAQRQQQRGVIQTTGRRNPVAAPAHEAPAGPRRSERLRNH